MTETIRSSWPSFLFFIVVPLIALGFAIAAFVPSSPKSVALIVILLFTAIVIRLSNWVLNRGSNYAFNNHDFTMIHRNRNKARSNHNDEEDPEEQRLSQRSHHSSGSSSRRSHRSRQKFISSIRYYNTIQPLMRPSQPVTVILYSSILTFILILLVRLFSVGHFGGSPELLDFGQKVSKNKTSPTNIAMEEFDFDTFAHFIQGVLTTFLTYPAVSGVLAKVATRVRSYFTEPKYLISEKRILLVKPSLFMLNFIQLLQSCMVYYPFYSMIKRLRYTSFAQSSHLNNCTEWVLGSILGLSLGSLVSSLVQRKLQVMTTCQGDRSDVLDALSVQVEVDAVVAETDEEINNDSADNDDKEPGNVLHEKKKQTRYIFGRASEYKGITEYPLVLKIVEVVSILNLIVFAATVVLSGVFIGLSWNYDDDDKVNGGIAVLYILIAISNFALFYFFSLLK